MKQKKIKDSVTEFYSEKTNKLVFVVNSKTKEIKYYVHSDRVSDRPYSQINFKGFDKLPGGFYTEGYGITTGAYLIDRFFKEKFGDQINITISKTDTTSVKKQIKKLHITFNYKDFKKFQERLKEIKKEKNKVSEIAAQYYFNKFFPAYFEAPLEAEGNIYNSGDLATILTQDQILESLSTPDVKALDDFYMEFLKLSNSKLSSANRLFKITKNKNEAEVIYLENIISEFEKKLKQNLTEGSWQTFLREYILLFNTNYTNTIEKANVTLLSGRYPDFMLIDVYNYLDIYEIKKPNTSLLKEDKSRNNYYWDTEISKAISQVENYIHLINKNSSGFREEIKRSKGLDIRVVKPRGIIIAGTSKQFKGNEVMEDNFRLLNRSLKNVEIILYDELLSNLKIFLDRIKA